MVHDRITDVRKYVPCVNEAAIDGIVKHLGGALRRHLRRAKHRLVPASPITLFATRATPAGHNLAAGRRPFAKVASAASDINTRR
jgi:hypothetical protein